MIISCSNALKSPTTAESYLLTPNPAEPQQLRLCVGPYTLPVKTYDNDTIPTADSKIPMILGDLMEAPSSSGVSSAAGASWHGLSSRTGSGMGGASV